MVAKLTKLTHKRDTAAPSGRELCHLQFSRQAASSETSGYTIVDGSYTGWTVEDIQRK
jgi:hypothetical protein